MPLVIVPGKHGKCNLPDGGARGEVVRSVLTFRGKTLKYGGVQPYFLIDETVIGNLLSLLHVHFAWKRDFAGGHGGHCRL